MKILKICKTALLFITALSLVACSNTITPIDKNTARFEGKPSIQGYLLFGVNAQAHIKQIAFTGRGEIFSYAPDNANQENSYVLAKLPVGDYSFSDIETGLREHELYDEYQWNFSVKANRVNYVGHLEINDRTLDRTCNCAQIHLVNKSSQALEYLLTEYPNAVKNLEISYQGPEEDGFIDFLSLALKTFQKSLYITTSENERDEKGEEK